MTIPSDQNLANKLSTIASSAQPTITQSGDTLTITYSNGESWVFQRKTSRTTRSQSIKSR